MNLERVNQSFSAFRDLAGLEDGERLAALMDAVVDSGQAGPGGIYEHLFLLLADLVEAQDARHAPLPDAPPEQVVRFLMQQHGLDATHLPEIGDESAVIEVLEGQRLLDARQIARLSQRFGINPAAFIPDDALLH